MKINLQDQLIKQKKTKQIKQQQSKLDAEIDKLLSRVEDEHQESLLSDLGFDYKLDEYKMQKKLESKYPNLSPERIFTKDEIKNVCIKYGLRFLPTTHYKGQLDSGIGPAKADFEVKLGPEDLCDTETLRVFEKVNKYYIAAPKKSFVLRDKPKDPLLFYRIDDTSYYLVHKWGDDLSLLNNRYLWVICKVALILLVGFCFIPLPLTPFLLIPIVIALATAYAEGSYLDSSSWDSPFNN